MTSCENRASCGGDTCVWPVPPFLLCLQLLSLIRFAWDTGNEMEFLSSPRRSHPEHSQEAFMLSPKSDIIHRQRNGPSGVNS